MARNFTNFHAGCHGPVPLKAATCPEYIAPHFTRSRRTESITGCVRSLVSGRSTIS